MSPLGTEHYEVASPRRGRPILSGARKRQATADTFRTLSALPALSDVSAGQLLSPGPDATMEEFRSFCVTMFTQHDKALVDIAGKMKLEREEDNKVAISVNDRF